MTTILGIECKDGVVIASDSLATIDKKGKTTDITKITKINDYIVAGGAGDADHIKLFLEKMKEQLPNTQLSNNELKDNIENIFLQLYKRYNVDRSKYLELDKIVIVFNTYNYNRIKDYYYFIEF